MVEPADPLWAAVVAHGELAADLTPEHEGFVGRVGHAAARELMLQALDHAIVPRARRHHHLEKALMPQREVDGLVDHDAKTALRSGGAQAAFHGLIELAETERDHLVQECAFIAEMFVDGGRGDVRDHELRAAVPAGRRRAERTRGRRHHDAAIGRVEDPVASEEFHERDGSRGV